MNKRMLDGSIWANEKFSEMPPMACLLLVGMINLADDQGRMKAHPAYLRSQIFPYRDVNLEEMSTWLSTIVAHGTALAYAVDGKDYLQLVNWWQYQSPAFAAPSDYPRPEGWKDRIRYTGKGRVIYTYNWTLSDGELLKDTCDQDGNPLKNQTRARGRASGQPVAHARGRASGQPVAPLNKDKDKDKTTTTTTPPTPPDDDDRNGGSSGGGSNFSSPEDAALQCWEENIKTPITPIVAKDLKSAVADHGLPSVVEAIAIAVRANNPTMRYIKGVLTKRGSPSNGASLYEGATLVRTGGDDD